MSLRKDESPEAQARAIQQQNAALMWAAENGYDIIVNMMLALPGIDRDAFFAKYADTALISAIRDSNDEARASLIKRNNLNNLALVQAAKLNDSTTVRAMLEQGADPNTICAEHGTPLIWASNKGNADIVSILIKAKGINVNAVDKNNQTALLHASYQGHTQIVLQLLAVPGINIHTVSKKKSTALSLASKPEIINALLSAYAKWLLSAQHEEVFTDILDTLKPHKEPLFAELMKLSPAEQLDAVKKIIEGKETTALGKVFHYGKKTLNKGVMATVLAKHEELTKTEIPPTLSDNPLAPSLFSRAFSAVFGTGEVPELKVTLGTDAPPESAASRFEKL